MDDVQLCRVVLEVRRHLNDVDVTRKDPRALNDLLDRTIKCLRELCRERDELRSRLIRRTGNGRLSKRPLPGSSADTARWLRPM